jgi:hypothetical protein
VEVDTLSGKRRILQRPARHSSTFEEFSVGTMVKIWVPTLRKKGGIHPKRDYRYLGPYQVTERFPHQVYRLLGEDGRATVVHASRLAPYQAREDASPLGGGVLE